RPSPGLPRGTKALYLHFIVLPRTCLGGTDTPYVVGRPLPCSGRDIRQRDYLLLVLPGLSFLALGNSLRTSRCPSSVWRCSNGDGRRPWRTGHHKGSETPLGNLLRHQPVVHATPSSPPLSSGSSKNRSLVNCFVIRR